MNTTQEIVFKPNCVENHFFVQDLQENYAVLWTLVKATRRMAKKPKL